MSTDIFVYDGQCQLCRSFARWARHRTHITFVTEANLTSRGVTPEEYARHAVLATDRIYRGHAAIAHVLTTMPWPWRWCGQLFGARVVEPLSARIYSAVARYRTCSIVNRDKTVATERTPAPR